VGEGSLKRRRKSLAKGVSQREFVEKREGSGLEISQKRLTLKAKSWQRGGGSGLKMSENVFCNEKS